MAEKKAILGTQPLQLALSPGTGVDFWHPRMLGRRFPLVASIIEILPENHADLALDCNQLKGLSCYDRQEYKAIPEQRGQRIDFYC